MDSIIGDLIITPFGARSKDEQVKIALEGRPRPFIEAPGAPSVTKSVLRKFQMSDYDTFPWMAGNSANKAFYCWPCLLFARDHTKWTIESYLRLDIARWSDMLKEHENEESHINCDLQLHIFTHNNIPVLNRDDYLDPPLHNELVKRNRQIIKRLIDIVFCQLSLKKSAINSCSVGTENCIRGLELLKSYDSFYSNHFDDASYLLKIEPNILPALMNSLCATYFDCVKKEMTSSTYVSLILSEHSTVGQENSLISAILRYIRSGKICERFAGYLHVGEKKSKNLMTDCIVRFIQDINISDKLVALALDGAVVSGLELENFLKVFYRNHPFSFFLPWCSHKLDHVLLQSLAHLPPCDLFLKYLNQIGIFFKKNSSRRASLDEFMCTKHPFLRSIKWYKKSQLPNILHSYRITFIQFFAFFSRHFFASSAEDVIKAQSFCEYLKKFETIFLLEVFNLVFEHTSSLNTILKSQTPECFFSGDTVQNLHDALSREKGYGFKEIWDRIISAGNIPEKFENSRAHTHYFDLFESILGSLLMQIYLRFDCTKRVQLLNMFNYDSTGKINFGQMRLDRLVPIYRSHFDQIKIKSEIKVFCENSEFHCKSVYEISEMLHDMDLSTAFKDVSKIVSMILTVPCKPPSPNGGVSKLKTLEKNSCQDDPEICYDLNLIKTEMEFFLQMRKKTSFYDSVILNFQNRINVMKLQYK